MAASHSKRDAVFFLQGEHHQKVSTRNHGHAEDHDQQGVCAFPHVVQDGTATAGGQNAAEDGQWCCAGLPWRLVDRKRGEQLYISVEVLTVVSLLCFTTSFLQEMYTGVFTEEEFRSLGIMAPFVVDEVFIQLDRSFFTQNLDYLWGLCYKGTKMDIVARILQEPAAFG